MSEAENLTALVKDMPSIKTAVDMPSGHAKFLDTMGRSSIFELVRADEAINCVAAAQIEELAEHFTLVLAECDSRPRRQRLCRILSHGRTDARSEPALRSVLLCELRRITGSCREGGSALGSHQYRHSLLTLLTHEGWIVRSELQSESFLFAMSWLVGSLFADNARHGSRRGRRALERRLLSAMEPLAAALPRVIQTLSAPSMPDPNLYHAKMLSLLYQLSPSLASLAFIAEYYVRNVVLCKSRLPLAAMENMCNVLSALDSVAFGMHLSSPLQKLLLRSPELAVHVMRGTFRELSLDTTDVLKTTAAVPAPLMPALIAQMKSTSELVRIDATEALKCLVRLVDARSEASVCEVAAELLRQAYGKIGLELKLSLLDLLCELRPLRPSEKTITLIMSCAAKESNDASLDLLLKALFHLSLSSCAHGQNAASLEPFEAALPSFLLSGLASERREVYLCRWAAALLASPARPSNLLAAPELLSAAQQLLARSESLVTLASLHCIFSFGLASAIKDLPTLAGRYANEKTGLLKEKSLSKLSPVQCLVVMHSVRVLLISAGVSEHCKLRCCDVLFYFASRKERELSHAAFESFSSVARSTATNSAILPRAFSCHVRQLLFGPACDARDWSVHRHIVQRLLRDWVAQGDASLRESALVASLVPLHHPCLCPVAPFAGESKLDPSRCWLKLVSHVGAASFVASHRANLVREALAAALSLERDAASSRLWSQSGFSALGALLRVHPALVGLSLMPVLKEMLGECLLSARDVTASEIAIWKHRDTSRPFVDVLKRPQPKKTDRSLPPSGSKGTDERAWEAQLRNELELKRAPQLSKEERALVEQQQLVEKDIRARLNALLLKLQQPLSLITQLFGHAAPSAASPELEAYISDLFRALTRLLEEPGSDANLFLADPAAEALIQKSLLLLASCVRLTDQQSAVPCVVYFLNLRFAKSRPAWIREENIAELFERLRQANACATCSTAGLPLLFPLVGLFLCDQSLGVETTRRSAFNLLDSFVRFSGASLKWIEAGSLASDMAGIFFRLMEPRSAFKFDACKSLCALAALLQSAKLSLDGKSRVVDLICDRLVDSDPFVRLAALQALQRLRPLESEAGIVLKTLLWMGQFDMDSKVQLLAQDIVEQLSELSLAETVSGAEAVSSLVPFLSHRVESVAVAAGKALAALTHLRPETTLATLIQIFGLYEALVSPAKEAPRHLKKRLVAGLAEDWRKRAFLALSLREIASLMSLKTADEDAEDQQGVEEAIEPLFLFLIDSGLSDVTESVRQIFLETGLIVIQENGALVMDSLLSIFDQGLQQQSALAQGESVLDSAAVDALRISLVIFIGSLGRHLGKGDPRVDTFGHRLVDLLSTPSQVVQESVAGCLAPLLGALEPPAAVAALVDRFKAQLFSSEASFATRKGAAYGLAAAVKGRGIATVQSFGLSVAMLDAMQQSKGRPEVRLGGLMLLDACLAIVGRVFEPYIGAALPHLLACFGDASTEVRAAAADVSRSLMRSLSRPCFRLLLPQLLESLAGGCHWRSKASTVELLAALSYLEPAQLSESIFAVVPRIVGDALSDSHPTVQRIAQSTLSQLGSSVSAPEVKSLVPFIVLALAEPAEHLAGCLNALAQTCFSHYVDATALALLAPVLDRGLRERSSELKKKSAQSIGNLCCLAQLKDLALFLPPLLPLLQRALLDPVPGTRDMAAKALGVVARTLGAAPTEAAGPDALVPDLFHVLRTSTSSVDRAGAAQGLSEIFFALGKERLEAEVPFILSLLTNKPQLPFDREGALILSYYLPSSFGILFVSYLSAFFMPLLLAGSESESGQEISREACRNLIALYAHILAVDVVVEHGRERVYVIEEDSELQRDESSEPNKNRTRILVAHMLLLNIFEGFGSLNWRVRQASIELLGRFLEVRFPLASSIGSMASDATGATAAAISDGPLVWASVSASSSQSAQTQRILATQRMLAATLGADYSRFIARLYLIRFDEHSTIRQASLAAWKSIIEHTPRTLREVLPTLLQLIVNAFGQLVVCEAELFRDAPAKPPVELAALLSESDMAARAFSDLLDRLGDRLLPNILREVTSPSLLGSECPTTRAGVSIAVIELIMAPTTRELLLAAPAGPKPRSQLLKAASGAADKSKPLASPFADLSLGSLEQILGFVISDAHPAVRFSASRAVSALHEQSARSCLQSVVESLLVRIFDCRSAVEQVLCSDPAPEPCSEACMQPIEGLISLFSFIDAETIVPACLPCITRDENQGLLSCYLLRRMLRAAGSSVSRIPSLIVVGLPLVLQLLASELKDCAEAELVHQAKKSIAASVLWDWMKAYASQTRTHPSATRRPGWALDRGLPTQESDGESSGKQSDSEGKLEHDAPDTTGKADRRKAASDNADIESFFQALHTHFVRSAPLSVGAAAGISICLSAALHGEALHGLLSVDSMSTMLSSLVRESFDAEQRKGTVRDSFVRDALQSAALFSKRHFEEEHMTAVAQAMDEIDPEAIQSVVTSHWPEALVALVPVYTQALLSCGDDENVRVRSAVAIREVIDLSGAAVLGPHVMGLAGPLIRVLGERLGAEVRSAILVTLVQLQGKAGAFLKAFVPQLLRVYLKALVELTVGSSASRRGRQAAADGLALLVPLVPRMEPLMNELHGILSCLWESVTELDAHSPACKDERMLLRSLVHVALLAAQKSSCLPNASEWQSLLQEILSLSVAQDMEDLFSDCHQVVAALKK